MIKKLFYLAFLALFIYSVILLATPYYHYQAFKSDLEEILGVSITDKPEDVMGKILNLAEQYNVPIKEDDVKLSLKNKYEAQISWQETVVLYPQFMVYQKTFEFHIDTSK